MSINFLLGGHDMPSDKNEALTPYFKGDKARYIADEPINVHGGLFWEVELLEGHLKGKIRLIKDR